VVTMTVREVYNATFVSEPSLFLDALGLASVEGIIVPGIDEMFVEGRFKFLLWTRCRGLLACARSPLYGLLEYAVAEKLNEDFSPGRSAAQ